MTISEVRDRESIEMYHKFIRQRKHQKVQLNGSQDPEEQLDMFLRCPKQELCLKKPL